VRVEFERRAVQMRLSEVVNRVIELSSKIYDYYAAELPKRHPNYPLVNPDDESTPPPPEEKELRDFLAALPGEVIYQLLLIMYLGREGLNTDDLAGYYESLKELSGAPADAASLLLDEATLADELADGLEELRKHKINVDKMLLKKVRQRKP
jgi:hypothetical protein